MAAALAAVLLATRRLRRDGAWVRVGIPPVADADRVLRAAAEQLAELTGQRTTLHHGGFTCERPAAALRWLRRNAANVVHGAMPASAAARLLPYDERGLIADGRWCAAVIRGRVTHFSRRPRALEPGGARVRCRRPEMTAMAMALAGGRRRVLARACRAVLGEPAAAEARRVHEPMYVSLEERLVGGPLE